MVEGEDSCSVNVSLLKKRRGGGTRGGDRRKDGEREGRKGERDGERDGEGRGELIIRGGGRVAGSRAR